MRLMKVQPASLGPVASVPVVALLVLSGCGDGDGGSDAGSSLTDSGSTGGSPSVTDQPATTCAA